MCVEFYIPLGSILSALLLLVVASYFLALPSTYLDKWTIQHKSIFSNLTNSFRDQRVHTIFILPIESVSHSYYYYEQILHFDKNVLQPKYFKFLMTKPKTKLIVLTIRQKTSKNPNLRPWSNSETVTRTHITSSNNVHKRSNYKTLMVVTQFTDGRPAANISTKIRIKLGLHSPHSVFLSSSKDQSSFTLTAIKIYVTDISNAYQPFILSLFHFFLGFRRALQFVWFVSW